VQLKAADAAPQAHSTGAPHRTRRIRGIRLTRSIRSIRLTRSTRSIHTIQHKGESP